MTLASMVLAVGLLVPATRAEAQLTDEDRARIHFQTGTSYYDQGRYIDAAAQFRDSYELSRRAHILLNVSRCFELAGQYGQAADALEEYLAAEPGAQDRHTLEQRIEQLRSRAGPEPTGPQTDPGSSGGGGGADFTVPAILLGAGGVLALGAVGTGIATLDIQSSLDERCGVDRVCDASLRSEADTGQALAITTDVLIGTAAVTAGIGLVLLIVALSEGSGDEEPVTATAACGPTGCMAGARGSF